MARAKLPDSGGVELIEQAEKAAVGVLAPEARPVAGAEPGLALIGSGFFVTPELVLTCAHVVADEPVLYLLHKGDRLRVAEVELIEPDFDGEGSWPVPDLALLRVAPAAPGQADKRAPVWLDLAPNAPFLSSAGYLSLGYDERGPGGRSELASRLYDGGGTRSASGVEGWPDFKYFEITGDRVPKFRSGSMVIDLATGRVTGIVKAARAANDGEGGYAVPLAGVLSKALSQKLGLHRSIDILADHDKFHARVVDWPAMCEAFFAGTRSGAVRTPVREAALLGLLARIRHVLTPSEMFQILESHAGLSLPKDAQLRDLALALAETATWSSTDVHSLLRFLDDLAARLERRVGDMWLADARRWADDLAAALNQTGRLRALRHQTSALRRAVDAAASERSSLQVLVDPAFDPAGGFHISIRMYFGALSGAEQFPEETVPSERVLARLRDALPDAVREASDLDGSCLVDLVLPTELLAEPIHRWEALGAKPIGRLLPVVVRSVERYRDQDGGRGARLRERWTQAYKDPVSLHWIMCEDREASGDVPGHIGLGLVNPPSNRQWRSRRLLDEAIDTGLPLLVWSASSCGVDHEDPRNRDRQCSGPYFQELAEDTLHGVVLEELPHHLFALRAGTGGQELDSVAVFWDDPELSHEENMLTEPRYPEDL
ncbi:MAG: trypsin-like peptidase domain-containing protein [Catenulispora sp.]|nr:trypsin-like peptidase domain-containing protein [Catenulispora sp.]